MYSIDWANRMTYGHSILNARFVNNISTIISSAHTLSCVDCVIQIINFHWPKTRNWNPPRNSVQFNYNKIVEFHKIITSLLKPVCWFRTDSMFMFIQITFTTLENKSDDQTEWQSETVRKFCERASFVLCSSYVLCIGWNENYVAWHNLLRVQMDGVDLSCAELSWYYVLFKRMPCIRNASQRQSQID